MFEKRLHTRMVDEDTIRNLPLKPVSYDWGKSRGGQSVARYYIEKFIRQNKEYIKGAVLEIGDARYSMAEENEAIEDITILSLEDEEKEHYVKGNLETGEGLNEETFDCIILTNVLSCLFDVQLAVSNVGRILKKGGSVIITVPGIGHLNRVDYESYGQYWRFTPMGLSRLLEKHIPGGKISITTYGNVKTSVAFLYGLCTEDLTQEELDYRDDSYPLLIGICVEK